MTKQVLLFGALAAAGLLSMWLLLDVASAIAPTQNHQIDQVLSSLRLLAATGSRLGKTPFSGLSGAFCFWIGLLAIALVRDYVVRRRDRNAVRPFAAALKPEALPEDAPVTQGSHGFAQYTSTSGNLGKRNVSVTLRDVAGTRSRPIFWVDVSCDCPWVLDIRRKSTFARLLGWAGSAVATGNPELNAAVVVQADDEIAVRRWLSDPAVRNKILSLFRQHKVESLGLRTSDSGAVLRCELATSSPFLQPTRDAAGIAAGLCALAESAESCAAT